MIAKVELPDIGDIPGDEVAIQMWLVDEEDEVEEGDELVEVVAENDILRVPSPATGTVVEIRTQEDESAKIGDVLCTIETPDEE